MTSSRKGVAGGFIGSTVEGGPAKPPPHDTAGQGTWTWFLPSWARDRQRSAKQAGDPDPRAVVPPNRWAKTISLATPGRRAWRRPPATAYTRAARLHAVRVHEAGSGRRGRRSSPDRGRARGLRGGCGLADRAGALVAELGEDAVFVGHHPTQGFLARAFGAPRLDKAVRSGVYVMERLEGPWRCVASWPRAGE